MTRTAMAAAALAAALLTPAHADARTGGGLTCGLAGVRDAQTATAAVTGGPWRAPESAPDSVVVVRCVIEAVVPFEPPQVVADLRSAPGQGTAMLAPTLASFRLGPGATVAVCTEVTVYTDGTPYVYQGDADGDPSNGAQCATPPPGHTPVGDVLVVPPQAGGGEVCVTVDHDLYPPVPRGACPPLEP
jgi:hypothetical protein